jgi:hypothetical protein
MMQTPKLMKRYFTLFLIAAAAFSSCKKDDDCTCPAPVTPTAATPANNYIKLAIGNYWVYDDYTVDTNNVATLDAAYDSAYVYDDSVINGNTYYKLFDLYLTTLLRDSSGFIVDQSGKVHFTNVVFNLPIAFTDYGAGIGYSEQMTLSTQVSQTVPAGTFTAYDWQTTAHFDSPHPWSAVRYAHAYYSENVGKVKQVYFFYSQSETHERRLNHYHVQ